MGQVKIPFFLTPKKKFSRVVISKLYKVSVLFRILKIMREKLNIKFDFKPTLTNEELLSSHYDKKHQDKWIAKR